MKYWFKIIILIVAMSLCFSFVSGCKKSDEVQVVGEVDILSPTEAIQKKIEANNAVRTYINNVSLYNELIELEPTNIEWYKGLGNTYSILGQQSKCKSLARKIIKLFPDDKTGYLMLIKYYSDRKNDMRVISTYNAAPSNVQNDAEFLGYYKNSEWAYKIRGVRREYIGSHYGGNYVFSSKGLYGYIRENLYNTLPAKYNIARPFIEDYAAVNVNNEWFFIDKDGYRVLATNEVIEDLYSMSEGFAAAKMNGHYGYVDSNFKKHSFVYEDATSFYNGVAAVKSNGKWGLIDTEFNVITNFIYDDVVRDDANICSRYDCVIFCSQGKYLLVNFSGKQVGVEVFDNACPFYSEYAAVQNGGKWGFINNRGHVVIDFIYDDASSCAAGIAAVKKGDMWGCVNLLGEIVVPFMYEDAMSTSSIGTVAVKQDDKYRCIQFLKFK